MKLSLRTPVDVETHPMDESAESVYVPATGTYVCPVCGETVKAADFGASLFHQRPTHRIGERRR